MLDPAIPALHVPRRASVVGSRRWGFTLAAMTGVTALSIDMSLPAQPTLARVFDVTADTAQLNLSLFMIGFAIAQLVMGYASDVWGRRRVLLGVHYPSDVLAGLTLGMFASTLAIYIGG